MSAIASAHAKLIVLGEHFVVPWTDSQGEPHPGSLALALPLSSLSTEIQIAPHSELVCEPPTGEYRALMENAVRVAASCFGWDLERSPLQVLSRCNFPISRGLGSSASFSVALSQAFRALQPKESPDRAGLFAIVQKIENLFHGKSSGLDTSVILENRPIVFRDGRVEDTFDPQAVEFIVVDSGPRDECAALVKQTLILRKEHPNRWITLTERVNDLARRCLAALQASDGAREVAATIREANDILAGIGLITPNVAEVLSLGARHGALAGKVSGAGAGGAVLFVANRGEGAALSKRLRDAGLPILARASSSLSLPEQSYA